MAGMLRVPRSRGALTGALLVLLGIWGGLIAFVGPYFHYAYTPDKAWAYSTGRLWLEILPGAATVLGGLIVGWSASRPAGLFGAWLAALSGAWFALGGLLSTLWTIGGNAGHPVGDNLHRVTEQIGFFTGLGIVIVFLAAVALGRFTVIGHRERLAAEAPAVEEVPEEDNVTRPYGASERVPASRLDDTRVDGDTVPENVTPATAPVEETHVAGTKIGDTSGSA
ncbi:MAG: hypothetical protein JO016_20010 [Actinobacteria bacterium]|nr:hypothetical protein [Actinomycetota bacterium]